MVVDQDNTAWIQQPFGTKIKVITTAEEAILKSGMCGSIVYSVTASRIFVKNIADDSSGTVRLDI